MFFDTITVEVKDADALCAAAEQAGLNLRKVRVFLVSWPSFFFKSN